MSLYICFLTRYTVCVFFSNFWGVGGGVTNSRWHSTHYLSFKSWIFAITKLQISLQNHKMYFLLQRRAFTYILLKDIIMSFYHSMSSDLFLHRYKIGWCANMHFLSNTFCISRSCNSYSERKRNINPSK